MPIFFRRKLVKNGPKTMIITLAPGVSDLHHRRRVGRHGQTEASTKLSGAED
jgi:hypothetical protein